MQKALHLFVSSLLLLPLLVHAQFDEADITTAELVIPSGQEAFALAPLEKLVVNADVHDTYANVIADFVFQNPHDQFIEALFRFPLPDNAAIYGMEIRIADRLIMGEIKEKEVAEVIYEQAKAEGKAAGLTLQNRPNLFTNKLANIPPNEKVLVTLKYRQSLDLSGLKAQFEFPMTFTPRFQSELTVSNEAPVDQVFVPSSVVGEHHRGHIHVRFNPSELGVTAVKANTRGETARVRDALHFVTPRQGVPMDKHFKLSWQMQLQSETGISVQGEETADGYYGLLTFRPALKEVKPPKVQQTYLYIIDTSGSMGGQSMRSAKQALARSLTGLQPTDRFNVVEFNSESRRFYPEPALATPDQLADAFEQVAELEARGGTEMLPAMLHGIQQAKMEDGRLTHVIFLTDGAISNESALFSLTQLLPKNARLFTIGIGAAPNQFFMRKMAEFGRGASFSIEDDKAIPQALSTLTAKLAQPELIDLSLEVEGGGTLETYPATLPDLYRGEALQVLVRADRKPESLRLKVKHNGQDYQFIAADQQIGLSSEGVGSLWARRKIESLLDQHRLGEPEERIQPQVTRLALDHQLLSPYTSFVAVEKVPVRPLGEPLLKASVPQILPQGMRFPQTGDNRGYLAVIGLLMLIIAGLLYLYQIRCQKDKL